MKTKLFIYTNIILITNMPHPDSVILIKNVGHCLYCYNILKQAQKVNLIIYKPVPWDAYEGHHWVSAAFDLIWPFVDAFISIPKAFEIIRRNIYDTCLY